MSAALTAGAGATTQHFKHMVDAILRTNSGFMHVVDTPRTQLTDPETVICLGDRDLDLGRTHAASDLMRQINGSQRTQRCASGPPGGAALVTLKTACRRKAFTTTCNV